MKSAALAILALCLSLSAGCATSPAMEKPAKLDVYVGSFADATAVGIRHLTFDTATGQLTPAGGVEGMLNPWFLAISPDHKSLYAVGGSLKPQPPGEVEALAIDPQTRELTLLGRRSSQGNRPFFVSVDKSGKFVLVANYGSGNVAAFPLTPDGLLLSPSALMQHQGPPLPDGKPSVPKAHSINASPDNRFAIAADLGLDRLFIYKFDAQTGTLTPNDHPFIDLPPGTGPRHLVFHPSGKFAYLCGEKNSTVNVFSYDANTGRLHFIQSLPTTPPETKNNYPADVQVHPSGKWVYVSNRGHDSIAVFAVDRNTGKLIPTAFPPTAGKTPRSFCLDPWGDWLIAANQESNTLTVFKIDPKTGIPSPTGEQAEIPKPACVRIMAP